MTITDEGTIDTTSGLFKRRQQKIYADVLGRTVKTEVLNWQGGGVYSATVNTYNARDQITQVREYAGPEGSATFQDTTMTYDGYGRPKTKHVPEQNAGTFTMLDYNSDDTIQRITDARGSVANFSYNSRHLTTGMTYTPSTGVADTPDVAIGYDAAGNRSSMTDGLGSKTYTYNQISRMMSEARTFTGVGSSFTLSYDYNLAGGLKSVTDHTNQRVNYSHDSAGNLSSLTGTNYSITQFINSVSYRAWGSPKQVAYGNGRTLSINYNSRLQASHLEIPSGAGFPATMSKDYQYYSDGRVSYSRDVLDARYDRAYSYDQSARITRALSGADARGQTSPPERPYNQISSYDAFDHLTHRTTRHWSKTLPYIASDAYTNNRRNGWQYDAAGNLLSNSASQYTYDAAGRMVSISGGNINQFFDGDGQRVKTTEPNVVTYYLRSSVVGQVIEELDGTGNKQRGFVYVGSEVMAEQSQNGFVSFVHKDASGISVRKTNSQFGNTIDFNELDPQGADVELEDPYLGNPDYDGRDEGGPMYPGYGNVTSPGNCTLDGVWVPCDMAYRALGSGAAVEAPQNTTRYNYTKQRFEFFRALADGHYGFMPAGAVYRGNGFFAAHAGWDSEPERLSNAPQKPVPQPPPTPTPTPKGIGLSDCIKKLIGFFFKTGPGGTEGIDLNKVQLHRDQLPGIPDSYKRDIRAITWGNDVYFNYNELNQNTIDGIVLIVHELTHVQQFKDKGRAGFLYEYGTDYLGNRYGGDTHNEAYRNIPIEEEAFATEKAAREYLVKKFGKDGIPCP